MPFATLTLELPDLLIADLRTRLNRPEAGVALAEWKHLINGVAGITNLHRGYVRSTISSAFSVGYYDCVYADAVLDTDTVTILGTALSYVTTPTTTAQFKGVARAGSFAATTDSGVAYGLEACINANATINRYARGLAVAGRCYVTCLFPSTLGNAITLAETGNGFTKSGSVLASGAADAPQGYERGYTPAT